MSAIDTLLHPRHRRACTYKAVKPFLSKPMPAIELKYFTPPSEKERRQNIKKTNLICWQCENKVAIVGSTNTITGEIICDICAIKNYRDYEGFRTIQAAKAHRRRMFDVGYLLTEVLIDHYLNKYSLNEGELLDEEHGMLVEFSIDLQNMIPIPKKTELQNSIDQSKIEHYYQRLIAQYLKLPSKRPQLI